MEGTWERRTSPWIRIGAAKVGGFELASCVEEDEEEIGGLMEELTAMTRLTAA